MLITKEYILECLHKCCSFGELTDNTFFCDVVEPLQKEGCFGTDWTWDNGASKGVLIFKGLDFVVKIPFCGEAEYIDEHWEDEFGDWHTNISRNDFSKTPKNWRFFNDEERCNTFCGASEDENHEWDYCYAETSISEAAIEEGIGKCFAQTELLGLVGDYPIYIQERCTIFDTESSSRRKELYRHRKPSDYQSLRTIRERIDFWCGDDDWTLDFLHYWGEEVLRILGDFIFDKDINDLHCGNVGYRKGVPVLVDYSGYRA